jgi:CheY-like chemotaxis protein
VTTNPTDGEGPRASGELAAAGDARVRVTGSRLPFVVGIGGSTGGLEAFHRFFDHMPADSGMSFPPVSAAPGAGRRRQPRRGEQPSRRARAGRARGRGGALGPPGAGEGASKPDVVLCDIGLPGMDGHEVARALRADPAFSGALLVAMTGYAQLEDADRAKQAGFDAHLAKPPSLQKLEDLLARSGGVSAGPR